ncbi:MAG: FtsQ-type POTRA domain-containing protein [Candidatus Ratteibacteria bacterium]|nr:FtsQ-type POTRA domain-containing protein [Candidatus Ratteibacteria bacterium]
MSKTEERVKEVRQQIWKKRKKRLKTVSSILGVILLIMVILNGKKILTDVFWNMEIFKVKEVKVTPEKARPLLTGTLEIENLGNLLFLDIDELHSRVSKIKEVESSYITKEFPSTLRIDVILRKPWALIEKPSGIIFIDREGKIIEASESPAHLIKVEGIDVGKDSIAENEIWKLDVLQEIERWYNYYNIQRYFKMDKITIIKPTEVILTNTENMEKNRKIIITGDNTEEQFQKIQIILEECGKTGKDFEYIDARFQNPAVKYRKQQTNE